MSCAIVGLLMCNSTPKQIQTINITVRIQKIQQRILVHYFQIVNSRSLGEDAEKELAVRAKTGFPMGSLVSPLYQARAAATHMYEDLAIVVGDLDLEAPGTDLHNELVFNGFSCKQAKLPTNHILDPGVAISQLLLALDIGMLQKRLCFTCSKEVRLHIFHGRLQSFCALGDNQWNMPCGSINIDDYVKFITTRRCRVLCDTTLVKHIVLAHKGEKQLGIQCFNLGKGLKSIVDCITWEKNPQKTMVVMLHPQGTLIDGKDDVLVPRCLESSQIFRQTKLLLPPPSGSPPPPSPLAW